MIELRTRILLVLVLLATTSEASPQTKQSGPPTRQTALHKTAKLGKSGDPLATGAMPALCFQPGIGWQSMHPELPGVPATPGANGALGLAANRPTSAAPEPLTYARSSSAKQVSAVECAGTPLNQKALGGEMEKFAILPRLQTNRETLASRHVNSPSPAHGSIGLEPVRRMPSALPPAPTSLASEAEPNLRLDQGGMRIFHAYISSIKLRRLLRNAPDFRTRIKLQQLQSHPAARLHAAKGSARPPQGNANRTSLLGSDTHHRPRHHSATLLSHSSP